MLSVNYNPSVMITQRNIALASGGVFSALERMSTGFRINRAADDAAGMYVATGLDVQIMGLRQAQRNVSDGISLLNTADGALSNMTGLLSRIRDLAVQGGNGVYDDLSREAMQMEADSLIDELYQVRDSAVFNGMKIFGDGVKASAANVSVVSTPRNSKILAMSDVSALSSNVVPEGYIGIYSAEDLDRVRDNLGGKYILMNDIDLSSFANWDPIGDKGAAFTGVFDGNGHVVKNLTIDRSDEHNVGLFGSISGAEIKNIGVVNADVKGMDHTGALVGDANTNSVIINSYATGIVSGRDQTGGLVGEIVTGSNISDCFATSTVTARNYSGGLVGWANGNINNCYATGNVEGNGGDIGGLVGWGDSVISNSYATGNVLGRSSTAHVGGIIGQTNRGSIINSYATGNVEGNCAGGIAGQIQGNSSLSNSYATGKVTGTTFAGGIAGWSAGNISNSFYDTDKTGQSNAFGYQRGSLSNVKGLTTSEMQDSANWTGWDTSIWDTSSFPPSLKNMPKPFDPVTSLGGNIRLQVGADSDPYANAVYVDTVLELGDFSVDFSSAESCAGAIDDIDEVMSIVTRKRSEVGAYINRLESVLDTQITSIENLTAAKSTIMDADIAQESADYVKNQILQQTSAALLSQAQSASSNTLLALLGGL